MMVYFNEQGRIHVFHLIPRDTQDQVKGYEQRTE